MPRYGLCGLIVQTVMAPGRNHSKVLVSCATAERSVVAFVLVIMFVIVPVILLVVSTLAIGTISFANVFLFLLDKHTITVNCHGKATFPFKDYSFGSEPAEYQRIPERADG